MLAKIRYNTVVGKKILMAVTGLAMCLFLVGHLVGNLQLLWSAKQFNGYAHFLTAQPVVILIELGLLGILLCHIVDALILLKGNYEARPIPYHTKKWGRSKSSRSKKTWSSTFMMWSGTAILIFLVFHIWHFKYHHPVASNLPAGDHKSSVVIGAGGVVDAGTSDGKATDQDTFLLAEMVEAEFRNPFVAAFYIGSMLLLGLHLYHAVSSAFTSLGANHQRYQTALMWFGKIFTVVVCGGFAAIPLLVFLKVIK